VSIISASIALLILFVWNEARAKHPLVPLSIFKVGNLAAANLTQLPITASLFSMFFFLTLYVQNILGFSPLQSGLAFLPMSLLIGASAISAPYLIKRVGYKPILVVAPLFLATALFILGHIRVEGTYLDILPAILIMPFGLGFSFVAISVAATSGIPPRESGLASGLLATAQQIGGSLGLAILATVSASTTSSLIASGTPPIVATVDGFHTAFYTGIAFAFLASSIALIFLRNNLAAATPQTISMH
jgi:predicted MFS family arabinose efflux permease